MSSSPSLFSDSATTTVHMATQTQKALHLAEDGTWSVKDRNVPVPSPGHVTVKIHSTALNPVDWKVKAFNLPYVKEWPTVLGSDAAGTIEVIGEGVVQWEKGDRV